MGFGGSMVARLKLKGIDGRAHQEWSLRLNLTQHGETYQGQIVGGLTDWELFLDLLGGGAWSFLVGGVNCLVNSDNERDLNLLNKLGEGFPLATFLWEKLTEGQKLYNITNFLKGLFMFFKTNRWKFEAITGLWCPSMLWAARALQWWIQWVLKKDWLYACTFVCECVTCFSVTEFEKNKGSFVMFIKLGIDHWNYWSWTRNS